MVSTARTLTGYDQELRKTALDEALRLHTSFAGQYVQSRSSDDAVLKTAKAFYAFYTGEDDE